MFTKRAVVLVTLIGQFTSLACIYGTRSKSDCINAVDVDQTSASLRMDLPAARVSLAFSSSTRPSPTWCSGGAL